MTVEKCQSEMVVLGGRGVCCTSRHATLQADRASCSVGRPPPMSLPCPQLKRTLRQVRRLELTLRFGRAPAPDHPPLVWDVFFSTKDADSRSVKYPLAHLLHLQREEFKAIVDEYFSRIYAQATQNRGLTQAEVYDPQLLARLGLPTYAGSGEIKQRFRALAKQYHPDRGGESAQFIELVDLYERLKDGPPTIDGGTR